MRDLILCKAVPNEQSILIDGNPILEAVKSKVTITVGNSEIISFDFTEISLLKSIKEKKISSNKKLVLTLPLHANTKSPH